MLEYVGERTEWVCYKILTSLYMLVALVIVYMRYFHIELYSASECYMYRMTGYYCPGCGGTRACIAFLHGHFLRSLLYHPVVPYTAVVYLIFMISHSIELLSKGNFAIGLRYRDNYIKFAGIIILVQWILRNFLKWKWGIDVLGN